MARVLWRHGRSRQLETCRIRDPLCRIPPLFSPCLLCFHLVTSTPTPECSLAQSFLRSLVESDGRLGLRNGRWYKITIPTSHPTAEGDVILGRAGWCLSPVRVWSFKRRPHSHRALLDGWSRTWSGAAMIEWSLSWMMDSGGSCME